MLSRRLTHSGPAIARPLVVDRPLKTSLSIASIAVSPNFTRMRTHNTTHTLLVQYPDSPVTSGVRDIQYRPATYCRVLPRDEFNDIIPEQLSVSAERFITIAVTILRQHAMHKHGLCRLAVSVRLSVLLSVTFMYRIKTSNYIFKIFSPTGSHTILVFPTGTL